MFEDTGGDDQIDRIGFDARELRGTVARLLGES